MESLVTAVVPSFRGAPRLETLCTRLLPVLRSLSGDLILVDDFSDDESWSIMLKIAEENPDVSCVRLARRCGQQTATMAGCAAAAGRWIVTLDDDLEHDPRDIPRLLDRAGDGYDLVYAVPHERPLRLFREAGSRLFGFLSGILIGKPKGLRLTSYRIMTRDLVERMTADRVSYVYVSALALRLKPRVSVISVSAGPRTASRTPLRRLAVTFIRTLFGYSALSAILPSHPVADLLPIAEVRRGGI